MRWDPCVGLHSPAGLLLPRDIHVQVSNPSRLLNMSQKVAARIPPRALIAAQELQHHEEAGGVDLPGRCTWLWSSAFPRSPFQSSAL